MRFTRWGRAELHEGFTLVEMLVAITVLIVMMVALFSVSAGVANIWKSSTGRVSAFQNARSAFSTLTATLSRATLNTYSDYASLNGGVYSFRHADDASNPSDPGNISNFVPTQFARASELHFLCGPTVDIAKAAEVTAPSTTGLDISATSVANPGHAVFFQAPLGSTANSNYSGLRRAMNSVGFYVQYGPPDKNLIPDWLINNVNSAKSYRFRLVEFVEPTESLQIYASTSAPKYLLNWIHFAGQPQTQTPRTRVLAEDVLLLIMRPRLSPVDEATVGPGVTGGPYIQQDQFGSIVCPNYHYDSRAWEANYPATRVNAGTNAAKRIPLMMNQLPPIIDVALVCVDGQSLARFDSTTATPPAAVQVPGTLFVDSSKMENDLTTYANQLALAHLRFHIQRATVGIQGAKWTNN